MVKIANRKTLLLMVGLFFLLSACREKEKVQLPIVIVEKPAKSDVQIYGEYVGRIRAASYVEVHARVEGYLEAMLFKEGKFVQLNEPLFQINSLQYKARLEKAKAQLKKAEAQAAKSKRDVERLKPLYEQHAASQLDLDNATAALEDAEANIAISKADLEQAQLELNYTTVKSPIAGYISERFVDVGALVGPGVNSKLAAVVKSDTVLVDFKMTALDYLRAERRNVRFGVQDTTRSWQPTVTVTLADNTEYPITGYVDFADPIVDPQTGTFGVRAELSNPNQRLLPGQFTKVKLLLDVRERAIVVPRKSVSIEKGGAFIYIIRRDNKAEKRFVQIGPEIQNNIVIERGLGESENVVIEGYHKLTPGMEVRSIESGDEETLSIFREEDAE
ncbi:membrane fusion protein (multidrug efflux system) [Parabacteroides sp. PF5-5]|uniref:efflux RND transporter periplasmic adaptor subunit n=2 Tax=unclassified Parabacteroides TaxID=2649774 RepID=UPI002475B254|nr:MULTISPECIES: efflux RND transporter periplasmic adaptor subunit [unclassified Parabacteroides]MDH6306402.1 membrane fusion protein (multidrug efflux system) [Parabacteroides sp. PH5-39]MDH6324845.1 membrane fusion protein (multidrug efflux system) [Parabacteroides sp. PH5-8]MDH6325474.1 membrane fusion protein (multidrug efflux system) [Parabacteroides sp. PH5-41]MDH6344338.1 membrane fusion protein (multidrug efflux system) [Parabacteroides sp. PH5-46]MDH6359684.1 membrane fusion protein 